jgi:hypothetical protein
MSFENKENRGHALLFAFTFNAFLILKKKEK